MLESQASLFVFVSQGRVSLCSPACPGTHQRPVGIFEKNALSLRGLGTVGWTISDSRKLEGPPSVEFKASYR